MYKFGSHAPRDLESFGIVGLLGEKCKIFYDSIFTGRHIGRVSDLLTARLKEFGPDEIRFRVVMMFSLYEAYRCQLAAQAREDGDPLLEPLVIECGVDSEKLAIGVAFSYPKTEPIDVHKLSGVSAESAINRFERFVAQMVADSDQVVVRVQPESSRVEIVSLLGLPGKVDVASMQQHRAVEAISLKSDAKTSRIKADYVELGDLDYNKLLKEDGPGEGEETPSTGQILSEGMADFEENTRVRGAEAGKADETRISGVTQHMGQDGDITLKTKGENERANADKLEVALKQSEHYLATIAQLQAKITELESQRENEVLLLKRTPGLVAEQARTDAAFPQNTMGEAEEPGMLKKLIQNIWPFNRQKPEAENEAGNEIGDEAGERAPFKHAQASSAARESSSAIEIESMDPETGKMLNDQVEDLQKTIERIKLESQKLRSEAGGSRAQKWADGMVTGLIAEKARIAEMAKKLNTSFRQKELELKTKERVFQEEIRKRDEQLKQRTYALDRLKEQISQMGVTLERQKSNVQGSLEEGAARQKLAFTQKLLAGAKEENMANSRKIAELKEQLVISQSATKTRMRTDIDLETLKTKYERMLRQNDEFKRANQQLMEKVNEIHKSKPAGTSSEELKKKLEAAMKLAATHQKDAELTRMKVDEMQKSESRLKSELNRTKIALKTAKSAAFSAAGKDNSEDGSSGGSEAA